MGLLHVEIINLQMISTKMVLMIMYGGILHNHERSLKTL